MIAPFRMTRTALGTSLGSPISSSSIWARTTTAPTTTQLTRNYHPSLATDAAMAAELATEIKSDLGW